MKNLIKKLVLTLLAITGVFLIWDNLQTSPTFTAISPVHDETLPAVEGSGVDPVEVVDATVPSIDLGVIGEMSTELYFFNQLTEDMDRYIYYRILEGLLEQAEEIVIAHDDMPRMHEMFVLVLHDHPEIFWVSGATNTTLTRWTDGRVEASFVPTYTFSGDLLAYAIENVDAAIERFLATVDPTLTEYELVRFVYEYIIRSTVYDLDAPHHQTIYSVFVNRASVCAGISRAAQLLLNRLGIFATYVTGVAYVPGTSSEPIGHAWNLVRVNGEYYFLDVTWGFPTFASDSVIGERIDVIYDYLLLTYDMIADTHTITEGLVLPEVNSLTHTFFYKNGMFYDVFDENMLLDALKTSVEQAEDWISFQFADRALFNAARDALLDDLAPTAAQHLMAYHGLVSTQYFVRERESLNKITFYWIFDEGFNVARDND